MSRFLGAACPGLIDIRLQWNGPTCGKLACARCGHRIARANSRRDFFCQFLSVRNRLGILTLCRVCQEPTLDQHCRNSRFSQDVVTAAPNSTIWRGRAARYEIMNSGSERETVASVKICLDSFGTNAFCR